MRRALALLLLLGPASSAAAQPRAWARALEGDDARAARRLVADGLRRFECALDRSRCGELEPPPPDLAYAQAAIRFERAAARLPDDLDVALLLAVARDRALGDDPSDEELAACIAAFEAVRARDPEHAAARVAFALAVLRTRVGDVEGAAAEYATLDRTRDLHPTLTLGPYVRWELEVLGLNEPVSPASYLGNWAEVAMLAGDAELASAIFERALGVVPSSSSSAALASWGLALARERAGNHDAALASACRAIDIGLPDELPVLAASRAATRARWGPFAALHDADVFFEPAHEVRAYEALGHECLAGRSASPEGRRAQLERARASWRFFLLEGGSEGRWAERARAAEARLTAVLEAP